MAVRHGHGKVATDGLVFAYDTGDTRNSYKGEPVQNLWDDMLNTQSLRTHTKHYWDGRKWIENATYSHPGVDGPKGTYLGLVFKHTSGALNSVWSGNSHGYMLRDIACTNGATMTMSSWIYASTDCDVTAIPAVIEGESGGESTVSGYPASYDLNNKGTWQIIAKKATSDGNTRFIPLYPRKDGVTDGSFAGFFMWALPQVTYGDHVVQPIQPGTTRSSTQGLLDLTGNTTIDLANVGYNSDAQIDFDATNDYISISNPTLAAGPYTILMVVKPGTALTPGGSGTAKPTGSARHTPLVGPGPVWNPGIWLTSDYIRSHAQTQYVDSAIDWTTTTWQMIGMTYDGTNVRNIFGDQILPNAHTTGYNPPVPSELLIGAERTGGNSYSWDGSIAVVNIYNRVLTATEIAQNFGHYKTRFGI